MNLEDIEDLIFRAMPELTWGKAKGKEKVKDEIKNNKGTKTKGAKEVKQNTENPGENKSTEESKGDKEQKDKIKIKAKPKSIKIDKNIQKEEDQHGEDSPTSKHPKNLVVLSYCFCKMTIVDEMNEADNYHKLEFVEFLEFIWRIANWLDPLDPHNKLIPKIQKVNLFPHNFQ